MNRYWIFFENKKGEEELGGSHYDFDRMCETIELFIRVNKKREYNFVSACEMVEGEIVEIVRWQEGLDVPILDKRNS